MSALSEFTDTEINALIRRRTREEKGEYDVLLPAPAERRRIREQAGWSQEDLGDELDVSRHTISRWEKEAVGYVAGERLPASGQTRKRYAELLPTLADAQIPIMTSSSLAARFRRAGPGGSRGGYQ